MDGAPPVIYKTPAPKQRRCPPAIYGPSSAIGAKETHTARGLIH
jgi:hypothetical protein